MYVGRVDIYIYIYIYNNKVWWLEYVYNWVSCIANEEVSISYRKERLYNADVMVSYIVSVEM